MKAVFLTLLNSSITAGWLVLAVLVLRLVLAGTSRRLTCALWALVAVRLLCPVTIESAFSLIPNPEPVKQEMFYQAAEEMSEALPKTGENANEDRIIKLQELQFDLQKDNGASDQIDPLGIGAILWGLGMTGMIAYAIIGSVMMERRLAASIRIYSNVYSCDYIDGPFIFGFVRPKIYLPSSLRPEEIPYVLAHEETHLKRRDHLWKPLGFLILSVHWFNPLLWLAYKVFCRDVELACDEQVVRNLDHSGKAAYSRTLLRCSGPGVLAVGPLAFGEKDVKHRIRSILRYKKPAAWLTGLGALTIAVAAACFLTDPVAAAEDTADTKPVSFLMVGQNVNSPEEPRMADSIILATVDPEDKTMVLTAFPGNTYLRLGTYQAHMVGDNQLKIAYTLGYVWGGKHGALAFLTQSIAENFDITIDGSVAISADAFIAVTDALGGIDAELEAGEVKSLIGNGLLSPDTKAGPVHLDGAAALNYQYMRFPEESAYNQVERQLTVNGLIIEKCQRLSQKQLSQLLHSLLPAIYTNMDDALTDTYVETLLPIFDSLEIKLEVCPGEEMSKAAQIDLAGTEAAVLKPDMEKCRQLLQKITAG